MTEILVALTILAGLGAAAWYWLRRRRPLGEQGFNLDTEHQKARHAMRHAAGQAWRNRYDHRR